MSFNRFDGRGAYKPPVDQIIRSRRLSHGTGELSFIEGNTALDTDLAVRLEDGLRPDDATEGAVDHGPLPQLSESWQHRIDLELEREHRKAERAAAKLREQRDFEEAFPFQVVGSGRAHSKLPPEAKRAPGRPPRELTVVALQAELVEVRRFERWFPFKIVE